MIFYEHKLLLQYPYENQNHVLVDVGAHEGHVSGPFAKQGWNVIAFEPERNNRNVFMDRLGDAQNVICIPKAVSDKSGDIVPFYISDKHYGIHSLKPFHPSHKKSKYDVETVTISDALNELGIQDITVLKIDIEGADYLALKGTDFRKYHPEIVMVEFMDSRSQNTYGYTHHDMSDYMKKYDYICYISEWAPIKEYGIKGVSGEQHKWLRCGKYPFNHTPAWGNLIFVQKSKSDKFERILNDYIEYSKKSKYAMYIDKVNKKLRNLFSWT